MKGERENKSKKKKEYKENKGRERGRIYSTVSNSSPFSYTYGVHIVSY